MLLFVVPPVAFLDPFLRTSTLRAVAVIPARFASTRLPGKPLADIAGRPMIEHVYRRAADTRGIDAVVVATDDERIAAAVQKFGGIARLTQATHRTGTDRIAEVARDLSCDILVNVQGDLPLIEPGMISEVLEPLISDATVTMSTLRQATSDPSEISSPHVVKVVVDHRNDALYFSRSPIPFRRDEGLADRLRQSSGGQGAEQQVYKHIGLYGFRRDFLLAFTALPQTPLEQAESLEQLRALEHGFRIRAVATKYESIEVDTPEDLERVRQLLATRV
ncbi:MAG TPA: 3-deoxy-manno-octulosonate cytidylyltransferase [Vicinamibacterales bacterium]|nr:3-deoxy-manno-octulosonate cytidylyltransferase [Vicinamibacterales bacterium]